MRPRFGAAALATLQPSSRGGGCRGAREVRNHSDSATAAIRANRCTLAVQLSRRVAAHSAIARQGRATPSVAPPLRQSCGSHRRKARDSKDAREFPETPDSHRRATDALTVTRPQSKPRGSHQTQSPRQSRRSRVSRDPRQPPPNHRPLLRSRDHCRKSCGSHRLPVRIPSLVSSAQLPLRECCNGMSSRLQRRYRVFLLTPSRSAARDMLPSHSRMH